AVMRRLFEKRCRILSPSMQFAGAPMAEMAFRKVGPPLGKRYGVDFVNLGYKSGNEALVLAMGSSIKSVYPTDTYGTPAARLPALMEIDQLSQASMVVEIAATDAVNIWIRQGQGRFHFRMVAGVSGVMAPEMYPYLQSNQLLGLLGGMAGAAEYESQVHLLGTATRGIDAQSIVHLLIVGLIVAGNVFEWMDRR